MAQPLNAEAAAGLYGTAQQSSGVAESDHIAMSTA